MEELQRTVNRENKDLNERNESLRRQWMEIGSKVRCSSRMSDGLRCDPSRWRQKTRRSFAFWVFEYSTVRVGLSSRLELVVYTSTVDYDY